MLPLASRSLGTLTLDLVAKTGGFREGMTAAERQAEKSNQKIRKETAETIDSIARFGAQAVLAAGAVAAALAAMGVQAIESLDRQAKLAKQLGATSEELMMTARAADLSGVEFEQLSSNMKRFNDTIGEAQKGNKTAIETLTRLGTTAAEVARMSLPDRIDLLSRAMEGLSTQSERAALAQDLFGKAGQEMLPLLQDSGESMKRAADEMNRFGIAISQVDAAKIEAASDDISSMKFAMQGLGNQLAVSFAPVVSVFSERMLAATKYTKGFGDVALDVFEGIIKSIGYTIDAFRGVNLTVKTFDISIQGAQVVVSGFIGTLLVARGALNSLFNIRADESFTKQLDLVSETLKKQIKDFGQARKEYADILDAPWANAEADKFFDDVRKRAMERPVPMPVVTMSWDGMNSEPTDPGVDSMATSPTGGVDVPMPEVTMTHDQILTQRYEEELAAQKKMLELKRAGWASEIAGESATAEATAEAWGKVTDAKQKEYQKNADFFQKGLDAIARGNSKASKVARALNLADTLFTIALQTKVAAINAYAFGSKLGGPILGAAFAGVAIAFGSAMASEAIAGSRGGSSGGGVPTAGVTTPDAPALADGQATAGRQAPPIEVTIEGKGLPSWEQVAEIMNMVGERMADSGGRMGKVTILTA